MKTIFLIPSAILAAPIVLLAFLLVYGVNFGILAWRAVSASTMFRTQR
jgi:hypothetical protein